MIAIKYYFYKKKFMLRQALLLFFIHFFCFNQVACFAQSKKIDSLKFALHHSKSSKEKAMLSYNLASKIKSNSPLDAMAYFKNGLKHAEMLKNDSLIAYGCNNIGYLNYESGSYNEAIYYLFKALKMFEQYHLDDRTIQCLQYIGMVYCEQRLYDKAMKYSKQALALSEKTNNKYSTGVSLILIGSIYYSQEAYNKALPYFMNALKNMEETGDEQGIADAINNVALIYENQAQYDLALKYHIRSLAMARKLNDQRGIAASLHNLGLIYLKLKLYEKALLYTDSSNLLSKKLNSRFEVKQSYQTLSEIYAAMRKFDLAYQYQLMYSKINDTLQNEDNKRQFAEMSTKYETDKKDNQILILNKDKQIQQQRINQQKTLRNFLGGTLVIVLFFAAVFLKQRNKIKSEKKRSDDLLLNILPEETAEELKRTGTTGAKEFEQVTVMFTDFKNFTNHVENLTAQELVNEINYYYSAFDKIIVKHGLEKIKTIGDSYMCAGGLPISNTTHAFDIISAAIEIIDFMQIECTKRSQLNQPYFDIRIGCHSGPVVAGIVGIRKFAYDIWGDTVNIASRMETNSEVGKINISGTTYDLIKDKFTCEYRGKVQAKGKGEIDMYFASKL